MATHSLNGVSADTDRIGADIGDQPLHPALFQVDPSYNVRTTCMVLDSVKFSFLDASVVGWMW